MAVSLLPNWLHVTLVFLLLPGEFYSFLLSGSAPLVHFILAVHVKEEDHIFMTLLCRLMVCFSQFSILMHYIQCFEINVSFAQLLIAFK